MRIVAIGLGGAGCRIVDSLYAIDRRSSRIACVQGLAVDVDETTLQQLAALPDSSKMYFPPFDSSNPDQSEGNGPTATIDISEIISRIHNFESGENDAIIICCGLGGRMADIVPHIITGLRSSVVEPIYGLVTLPCLAEGQKRSGKAADDIDILSPLLDGIILFDNETWYKKTKSAAKARMVKKERGLAQMLGFAKPEPEISLEMATYLLLNEAIVRRISLILKAGEFRADGGIDLAEVVLDSGEVLNTMKGGGFITIGYAVEMLPNNPLAFLSLLKPAGLFNEESKKRAARIVELAKQAIYHEVSTPCDMTSAHKALVLIAGPSHELSMQGFMTVRKWIDRSIRGIEMRSGDYPVMNTKNVAIIVMLSGLENIPRLHELREIREQTRLGLARGESYEDETILPSRMQQDSGSLRDEMIVLPTAMQRKTGRASHPEDVLSRESQSPVPERVETVHPARQSSAPRAQQPVQDPETGSRYQQDEGAPVGIRTPPHRRIMSPDLTTQDAQQPSSPMSDPTINTSPLPKSVTSIHSKEIARQRIEHELQRQRMMALSGSKAVPKTPPAAIPAPKQVSADVIIRPKRQVILSSPPPDAGSHPAGSDQNIPQESMKKTVVLRKRSPSSEVPDTQPPSVADSIPVQEEESSATDLYPPENSFLQQPEEDSVEVKDTRFRAKDGIFRGKGIRDTAVPKARDDSLIHTSLKPKKTSDQANYDDVQQDPIDYEDDASAGQQSEKKRREKDKISWI